MPLKQDCSRSRALTKTYPLISARKIWGLWHGVWQHARMRFPTVFCRHLNLGHPYRCTRTGARPSHEETDRAERTRASTSHAEHTSLPAQPFSLENYSRAAEDRRTASDALVSMPHAKQVEQGTIRNNTGKPTRSVRSEGRLQIP